jgi:hypothetical protein
VQEVIDSFEIRLDEMSAELNETRELGRVLVELEAHLDELQAALETLRDDLISLCKDTEATFEDTGLFSYVTMGCPPY